MSAGLLLQAIPCFGATLPDSFPLSMNRVLPIPDELAERLGASSDVARRALEAFGVAEYQAGRVTESELRRLLGFGTRYELDGFLKSRGVFLAYTTEDLGREQETLDRLGVCRLADCGREQRNGFAAQQ